MRNIDQMEQQFNKLGISESESPPEQQVAVLLEFQQEVIGIFNDAFAEYKQNINNAQKSTGDINLTLNAPVNSNNTNYYYVPPQYPLQHQTTYGYFLTSFAISFILIMISAMSFLTF